MSWTRAAITAEAASLDAHATWVQAGIADGQQAAADTSLSTRERQVAEAAAQQLTEQADHCRSTAAALRDGVHPTELGYQ